MATHRYVTGQLLEDFLLLREVRGCGLRFLAIADPHSVANDLHSGFKHYHPLATDCQQAPSQRPPIPFNWSYTTETVVIGHRSVYTTLAAQEFCGRLGPWETKTQAGEKSRSQRRRYLNRYRRGATRRCLTALQRQPARRSCAAAAPPTFASSHDLRKFIFTKCEIRRQLGRRILYSLKENS